jgi:hypothetical protein
MESKKLMIVVIGEVGNGNIWRFVTTLLVEISEGRKRVSPSLLDFDDVIDDGLARAKFQPFRVFC